MQKITVKELVAFRRKLTDTSKKRFAYKLKNRKEKAKAENDEGGGDYWITSTSCIYNAFKHDKDDYYDTKINELQSKLEKSNDTRTKSMYQRNLDILASFKDFPFDDIRPLKISKFESVQKAQKIFPINNLPIHVNPTLLFAHDRNGKNELGGLWLIPQLNGFKKIELGMFCEMLHRFMVKNYSHNYQISDDYCVVIDTHQAQKVVYDELTKGSIPFLIETTLKEIKGL